ncbi:unnamed protein product [Somion occarium]|uniref:Uncharacterized protein n=1 Tax=Somion occarium TaxID=3059160 RepID=A0ABP1E4B2_9APHY
MSFRNPPSSSLRLRPQAEDSNATEKTSLKSEHSEDPRTHPNTISQKPNTNIHSEDRALSYRNSNDPALLDSLTFIQGRRQRLSLTLIFPTILVVIGTAGVATLFLLCLLLHKTQANDVWRDRAFIVDEGTKLEGGRAAARLLGLTISSAASEIVSITTPILIGLYAFRVARDWLSLSRKDALEDDRYLPTPLQYGLLVGLLGGAGLGALMQAGSYLTRGRRRRVQTSSMLIQSFLVTLTIYILTHAISGVDLWLHALTTTVLLPTKTPVETPFKFSIGQDTCPPYPDPWYEAIHPCLMMEGGWGQGVSSLTPGMLVASNSSENVQIITLAEADDLAVLVKPNVQQSVAFRATTFGARASCQSVNALCVHGEELAPQNCTGFPPSFPPVSNVTNSGGLQEGDSKVFIQSSNCPPDVACEHISTDLITTLAAALNTTVPPVNAYSLWMQFLWEAGGDQVFGRSPEGNDAVDNYSNLATMLTN